MLTDVLSLLLGHLSVGDVFRLQRATANDAVWHDREVLAVLRTRVGLKPGGRQDLSDLRRRMALSRGRCRECGAKTRRANRVCTACARDLDGPYAQVTRRQMTSRFGRTATCAVLRAVPPLAGFAPGRAYLYWLRDVLGVLKEKGIVAG